MNIQKNPQFNQFSRMKLHQENLKNNTVMSYVIGVVITLIIALVECILFVCMVLGSITSMRLFHAKKYSSILKVDEGSTEDIPSVS